MINLTFTDLDPDTAAALLATYGGVQPAPAKALKVDKPAKAPKVDKPAKAEPSSTVAPTPAPTVTPADVQKLAADYRDAGGDLTVIKAKVTELGAAKVADLPAEKLPLVIAAIKAAWPNEGL